MSAPRISKVLVKFITYITNVNVYLHSILSGDTLMRGLVLGMTTAELDDLKDFFKLFVSGDPLAPGLWDLHNNSDTKNKKTRQDMLQGMKDFTVFFRPLLTRMSTSANIVSGDRLKLNIAPPVTTHKIPKEPIAENAFPTLSTQMGCIVKFHFRKTNDASRASKPLHADGVELAYRLDPPQLEPADSGANAGKVKKTPLKSSSDGTTKVVYTRASFKMQFPEEQAGYNLQFFARWVNTKYRNLDGPWTGPFGTNLS